MKPVHLFTALIHSDKSFLWTFSFIWTVSRGLQTGGGRGEGAEEQETGLGLT